LACPQAVADLLPLMLLQSPPPAALLAVSRFQLDGYCCCEGCRQEWSQYYPAAASASGPAHQWRLVRAASRCPCLLHLRLLAAGICNAAKRSPQLH
jgi:hypothetical protein